MGIDDGRGTASALGPDPLRGRSGQTPLRSEAGVAAVIEAWVTGRPHPEHSSIAFVQEEGAAVPEPSASGAVIAPVGHAAGSGTVIEYEGRFAELGDEMTIAGRTLELQDYAAAGFIEVIGPMVVRLGDASGWRALVEDADLAREEGAFPAHLLHPSVLLGERWSFLSEASGRPRAARPVFSAGAPPAAAPEGVPLASEADSPVVQAFGGVVEPARIASDLAARPWMGRYIAATELLRRTGRGHRARIVGLGTSLLGGAAGDREVPVDAPFVSSVEGEWLLEDLVSRRRFRISTEAATIVEAVLTSTTGERAVELVARVLGLSSSDAAERTAEVAAQLAAVSGASGTPAAAS